MNISKLLNIGRSPFVRHPCLIYNKVRQRTQKVFRFADAPESATVRYPEHLAAALRQWAAACDLGKGQFPWNMVFNRLYDEKELLELCRQGPAAAADLRGDVKLIWEFSRSYAFALNALTSEPEHLDVCARDMADCIEQWLDSNDAPTGVNWLCAMEVAIRAVNWVCADALLGGRVQQLLGAGRWAESLWNHGRCISERLEARIVPSNHYIANLMGLIYLGSIFPGNKQAQGWKSFASAEIGHAMLNQTCADGGLYEASLPYHALVAEMLLLSAVLMKRDMPQACMIRLEAMCRVLADATHAGGDVFQLGDNDSGRIIPLDFISSSCGRAEIVRKLATQLFGWDLRPAADALYPDSGWWISRSSAFTAILEFGGVGLCGQGSHAHNDLLSLCIDYCDTPVIDDPGSYIYTPDPLRRNAFRSTGMHNTLMIDGCEQLPIPSISKQDLFSLPGSEVPGSVCSRTGSSIAVCCVLPCDGGQARTVRRVNVSADGVEIVDRISGKGVHSVRWAFHLAPGISAEIIPGGCLLRTAAGAGMRFLSGTEDIRIEPAEYSPRYGSIVTAPCLICSLRAALPLEAAWRLEKM